MRFSTLTISALTGLCALSLSCSDGTDVPSAPGAQGPADLPAGRQALSLFGLGGAGLGVPGLACGAPQYRQFDFWVGTWEVTTGAPLKGANIVTREVGGCAVFENWHGAFGGRGRSMNVYDASDGRWHQQWVENSGFFPLRLDGGIKQGAMVMQGSYPDPFGTPTVFTARYTWTPLGRHATQSGTHPGTSRTTKA